jgi:flagellar hook-length control protein FliK
MSAPVAPETSHTPIPKAKLPQAVVAEIVASAKELPVAQSVDAARPAVPNKVLKSEPRLNAQIAAKVSGPVVVLDKSTPDAPQTVDLTAQPQDDAKPEDASVRNRTEQAPAEPAQPAAKAVQPAQPAAPSATAAIPVQSATAAVATQAVAASQPVTESVADQPNLKALAAQIAAKALTGGTKSFEIRLDPAELGRVDVHLSVARDGKAEATLYADRPETLVLLRGDSQNLERALKDAGLDVSNSSLNFSLKGEERQGDGGGASRAHTRNLSDAVVARSEAVNASLASQTHAPQDGRLDIRV